MEEENTAQPATPTQPDPNDPFYWTRMVDDKGQDVRVSPQNMTAAVKQGWKPFNPDRDFTVRLDPMSIGQKVKATELPAFVNKGFMVDKVGDYNKHLQDYEEATKAAEPTLSPLEWGLGLTSAAASGATFGLSDIVARGLFELEELALDRPEGYAADAANRVRELRDSLGLWGTGAEVFGAILTGGTSLATKFGSTAAKRVGLMALEGGAQGLSATAARQALEDPNVTATSYLANGGLGVVLGAGLGALGEKVAKLKPVRQTRPVDTFDVLPDNELARLVREDVVTDLRVPFKNADGDVIAEAVLSRNNPAAYHQGGKFGITLEDLVVAKDAPEFTDVSVLKDLTDRFGSISSPSSKDKIKDLADVLMRTSAAHKTKLGETWYEITADTLPTEVAERTIGYKTVKKWLELNNKLPPEGSAERMAIEKALDPQKGLFRRTMQEMSDDPQSVVAELTNTVREVDDYVKGYAKAASNAEEELYKLIPKNKTHVTQRGRTTIYSWTDQMKEALVGVDDEIKDVGRSIVKRGTADSDEAVSVIKDVTRKVKASKDGLSAKQNDLAMLNFLDANQTLDDYLASASKVEFKDLAAREALLKVQSILKNPEKSILSEKFLGEDAKKIANFFRSKVQFEQAQSRFANRFKMRKAGEDPQVSTEAVSALVRGKAPGRTMEKFESLDDLRAAFEPFHKAVIDLQESGLIKQAGLRDAKDFMPTLNRINEVAEAINVSRVFQRMSAHSATSAAVKGGSSMGGVVAGTGIASAIGVPPWIGALVGQNLTSGVINALNNPETLLKMADRADRLDLFFTNLANKAINTMNKTAPAQARVLTRAAILNRIGARKDDKNDTEYVKNVRTRVTELSSPELIQARVEDYPEPMQEPMKARIESVLKYTADNLPNPLGNQRVSAAEAMKVDKLLLSVVNPKAALERAVMANDTDTLLHLNNLWPSMVQRFQAVLSDRIKDEDMQRVPYQKRMIMQRLTGINTSGTSVGAQRLAQAAFEPEQEEGQGISPVSGPAPTVGAAIQAQA